MRIAFYAPLKSPEHPVPSGDRQMARALVRALRRGGFDIEIVDGPRSFSQQPHCGQIAQDCKNTIAKLKETWQDFHPDAWFSYHPYYKAPDFLGLEMHRHFGLPIFTAEASLAKKRDHDQWADCQDQVRKMLTAARMNFYFTHRDKKGLAEDIPEDRLIYLPPFIDYVAPSRVPSRLIHDGPAKLVTMGMMRAGVKTDSYEFLARALAHLNRSDWHLTIVGDGSEREKIQELFAQFPSDKITWTGEVSPDAVPELLATGDIFVWPGFGEAYGLAYLEAQAAGLPVVALATHGVPWVVRDGNTGLLVEEHEPGAFGKALARLIDDKKLRIRFSEAAREFACRERTIENASQLLAKTIRAAM